MFSPENEETLKRSRSPSAVWVGASAKEARFEGRHMPDSFHRLLYGATSGNPSWSTTNKKVEEDSSCLQSSTTPGEGPSKDNDVPAGYEQPDEAPDVEDLVKGHEDYSDLPPERRAALRKAVLDLCQRVQKHYTGTTNVVPMPPSQLEHLRVRASRLKGFKDTARKSELTAAYREMVREGLVSPTKEVEDLFVRKQGKSHSGVLVITVLMGPGQFSCPKDCHYCPNQPGVARSYLLKEPAVLRGFRNGWDPVAQFYDRASALEGNGHIVDKIELIILGGTFSFYPAEYAEQFIGACFYAANTYYASTVPLRRMTNLDSEIRENESAKCRIIGVTVETRPDYINARELRRFRTMGVTRVQLGIQHLDDDILHLINRDCPTKKAALAIQRLLDAGFKVDAHWMPDLPGSSYERDLEMFQLLLDDEQNESFQVDQWKVYPTATVPYTKISQWYEEGKYKPYAELDGGIWMAKLLLYIVTHAPYRLRLNRIVRDIPTTYIKGGERRVNLRQVLEKDMKKEGLRCKDIRERECKKSEVKAEDLHFYVDSHRASGGTEYYLSMENHDRTQLYGHLRLRIRDNCDDAENCILPVLKGAALIREVHTYGTLVAVDHSHPQTSGNAGHALDDGLSLTASLAEDGEKRTAQHRGIGSRLMREAEALAFEKHGLRKYVVIAGVGARAYYAKLGYKLEDTYMVKYRDAVENEVTNSNVEVESEKREDTTTSASLLDRLRQWKPF